MVTNPNLVTMNTEIKQNMLDGSTVAGDIVSYSNSGSWRTMVLFSWFPHTVAYYFISKLWLESH